MTAAALDHRPAQIARPAAPRRARAVGLALDPLARAMHHLREHYRDGESTEQLPTIAGMDTTEFRRAFRQRFGKTPATARAELQVADMQALLRQGVPQSTLPDRLGFSAKQRMSNAFREVTGKSPGEWLREEREKDPSIPAQPKRPGWSRGQPKSEETREKIRASVSATWAKRGPRVKLVRMPKPHPNAPVAKTLTGAALAAAEIRRGAEAFDEHQRLLAAEREAGSPAPFLARETRPSRVREEAAPIDPRRIHVVDNTPTTATVFDRFVPEPKGHPGGQRWWGDCEGRDQ